MFHLLPPNPYGEWTHVSTAEMTITTHPLYIKRWRRIYLKLEIWESAQGGTALLEIWEKQIVPEIQHCSHPPSLRKPHNNGSAESVKFAEKLGGCGAILSYFPSVTAIESKRRQLRNKDPKMLELLDDPDRCIRCNRVFQLSMGYGNQKILKCTGRNAKASTKCTMIKALPHEFPPCGPTRRENDISQAGSGHNASAERRPASSSTSPHSTGAGTINLEQLGISQEQLLQLIQQTVANSQPQSTVQLPLASPVQSISPGDRRQSRKERITEPTTPMAAILELDLTMECDDGLIHIPGDDLNDQDL